MRYWDIKELSVEAYRFITESEFQTWDEGRYELSDGGYVNVESYKSFDRAERMYESHRQYIDIQMIICGEEIIEIAPVEKLTVKIPYDVANDITFYGNQFQGERHLLKAGEYLIVFPSEGHMPCLKNEMSSYVRKAVIKVPIIKENADGM